jgi:hypothetical protein
MSVGTSESILPIPFHIPSSHHPSLWTILSPHMKRMLISRYAANAIILPRMDMYSNLLPTDASAMLDHLTPTTLPSADPVKTFNKHWRGRYGLTESEQEEIWAIKNPHAASEAKAKEEVKEERKVVELKFKTYEGELRTVKASIGDTLLQVARANDLPSMEGSCGGNLGMSPFTLFPSLPSSCPLSTSKNLFHPLDISISPLFADSDSDSLSTTSDSFPLA